MPDREYRIRILTVSDPTGAREAKAGIDEVAKSTERATQVNQEHHKGLLHVESAGRQLHKVLHSLTEASPAFGTALRLAISPLTGLITALFFALEYVRKAFEDNEKAAQKAAQVATDGFVSFTEAVNSSRSASEDALKKFKQQFDDIQKSQESAESASGRITSNLQAQKEAILSVMKAREQYELSQATDDRQRDQIHLRYASSQGAAGLAMERTIISSREQDLAAAQKRAPELQQALHLAEAALTSPAAEARLHGLSILEGNIDQTKDKLKEANEKLAKAQSSIFPSRKRIGEARDERDRLQAHLDYQMTERDSIHADIEDEKARVERARKAVTENESFIQKTGAEIPELQSQARLHMAVFGAEQSYSRATAGSAEAVTGRMFSSFQRGNLAQAIQDLTQVAALPVTLKQFAAAIKQSNAEVERAIAEQNRHNRALRSQIKSAVNP